MKILGIDEAGRGAVIGPLVICGALIEEEKIANLKKLKVRDSKELSPLQRVELNGPIEKELLGFELVRISPREIDTSRRSGINLNELEVQKMAQIINQLKPDKVYVDAVDPVEKNFESRLKKYLRIDTKLIAKHEADKKFPIVSAASILAKVARDSDIEELKRIYESDIGSGYPSDPVTKSFLSSWLKEHKKLPNIVRETWSTVSGTIQKEKQKTLNNW